METSSPEIPAAELIARELPGLLRRFPWPKSMRWGGSSAFTWVRPLRRILCILDGEIVPFDLRDGDDDGHSLRSGNLTEGHRFLSPGAFPVASCAEWREALRDRFVIVDAAERRRLIWDGLTRLAAERGLTVVEDAGLLDEVAGLVEWPVPLLGAIDPAHMDLPAEVMQVSMRVNQRYFSTRDADGAAAPFFAFVANVPGTADGGRAIIAGNERVLRARFADARHFWDLDRTVRLETRVAALDNVTFHAKLGSQGERVQRLVWLAETIAPLVGADPTQARRAATLCKADLITGMVGEFPELQGVMGRYYALHDGEDSAVAEAIRDHYAPKGPGDVLPTNPVGIAVALADKLDQLACFFFVDERPTGSGDPFALRRAALGIIRIIRERNVKIDIYDLLFKASVLFIACLNRSAEVDRMKKYANFVQALYHAGISIDRLPPVSEIRIARLGNQAAMWKSDEPYRFLVERLKFQFRSEGVRSDIIDAVLGDLRETAVLPPETGTIQGDLLKLSLQAEALGALLDTEDGANLLTAYRRAANILRIEEKKDGPDFHFGFYDAPIDPALLRLPEEESIARVLDRVEPSVAAAIRDERYADAMAALATLRAPLDAFFDSVTVNDPQPELRRNRLRLLARIRAAMNRAADFSRIDG